MRSIVVSILLCVAISQAQFNCTVSQNATSLCGTDPCVWTDVDVWVGCDGSFPANNQSDAFVNTPGTYSLWINETQEINTLYIGTGAQQVNETAISLTISGSIQFAANSISVLNHGVLTIDIQSDDDDNFFGGIDTNSSISVSTGGQINWVSGNLDLVHKADAIDYLLNILPGGSLIIQSGSKSLNQSIKNDGSLTILDGANLQVNGMIISDSDITFNGSSTLTASSTSTGGYLYTSGTTTFNLDSTDTLTLNIGAAFNGPVVITDGNIDVTNPVNSPVCFFMNLTIEQGASLTASGENALQVSSLVNNGLVTCNLNFIVNQSFINNGSFLLQGNDILVSSSANGEGGIFNYGTFQVSGNAALNVEFLNRDLLQIDEATTINYFTYDGTLSGDGSLAVLYEFVWLSGEIDDEPSFSVNYTTSVVVSSASNKSLTAPLAITGTTASFNSSVLSISNGASINFSNSTVVTFVAADFIAGSGSTGSESIVNHGTIEGDFTLHNISLENYGQVGSATYAAAMVVSGSQLVLGSTGTLILCVESKTSYSMLTATKSNLYLNGSLHINIQDFQTSDDTNLTLIDWSGSNLIFGNFSSISVVTSNKLTCTSANGTLTAAGIVLSVSGCVQKNNNKNAIIIGVCVGVGVVLIFAIAFFVYRRRRHHTNEYESLLKKEKGHGHGDF